jgi:asparagine synthetase B (glutamine-hydrolysing)
MSVREILMNQANIEENDVAVMMSGGVDSCSVLFSLIESKKNITAYSFTLEGHESTDFKSSQIVCEHFGIKFVPIYLPTSLETLKKDVRHLIDNEGLRKKTEIECTWAMMYALNEVKEDVVFTGHGADGHFGISKKAMINYRQTVEKLDTFRINLFGNPNYAQKSTLEKMAKDLNKKIIFPYLTQEMRDLFLGTSWESINKPKEKQPILDSFKEYFEQIKIRKHTNFQLGDSKIAEGFTRLLETDLNNKNYKSVIGIYNAISRGEV